MAVAFGLYLPGAAAKADGDAINGRMLFARCQLCHSTKPGETKVGPSLHGLFGRHAGSVQGFAYSEGMKALDIVWTEATIDTFIRRPKALVPGTKMVFGGLGRAEDRADLIAYLKQVLQAE